MQQVGEATAGGASGVFAVASMYPFVVVKTRLQAQRHKQASQGKLREADEYKNAVDCLVKIVKEEGVQGLFKGLSSSLPKAFVTNFIFYFFYAALRPIFKTVTERVGPFLGNMLHGVCTGVFVQLVMTPIELVNTRVIADKSSDTKFVSSFLRVLREEGVRGLYRGIIPSMVLTLNPGITNVVRLWLTPSGGTASNAENFWTGAASKACASFLTYPYVLAKIQIFTYQKGQKEQNSDETSELTVLGVLRRIYKDDGLLGFYKGFELQVGTAVAKEALLNTARYPIKRAIMSVFVGDQPPPLAEK